jgi:hypothetical protein
MTVAGNSILVSDFNGVRNDAVTVIGPGSASFGYGQIVFSPTTLTTTTLVAPGYLNQLRNDLFNSRAHQIGTAEALAETSTSGSIITATDISVFRQYTNTVVNNRFTAHPSRMGVTSLGSASRTTSWSVLVQSEFNITFANSPLARWFWNAGGSIRITSSRTGGSATAQNTSWTNLLAGAGTREFAAGTIYSLPQLSTTSQLFTTTATAPYASNRYTISAGVNGATGASGNGSQFRFFLVWQDPYVDPGPPAPGDIVDGTLSYTVELRHPIGGAALSGGGVWQGFNTGGTAGRYPLPTPSFGTIFGS